MKPHIFLPEADSEYTSAVTYYANIDLELGGRFYDEIERLICDITSYPEMFRLWSAPVRRHFSDNFPYAVLYVDKPDCILIIAIMHMSRNPDYWKSRIKS